MRWNEIRDGIAVFDANGKRVGGKSKKTKQERINFSSFLCITRII
jgi:hypothetical protein